ncbi:AAA family ATPase [Mesorhizobium sp. 1M-11]|uniref:ATP-binding protein n=1 Tax=Mesorhizobium sp. 1M-11 TaxID=1529006 RepID=UPI0006C74330|nr:AAA family ATPase [Mesorhizobium sp. 1M-11]
MVEFAGEILILTGTPGSGKTTTAKALAVEGGSAKVHLHSDDFWHFIKNGAIAPYLPEAHRQNAVVIDVLAKAAQGYARGDLFVIVDGIIGPWFLEPFKALGVPLHYVVLRPPLEVAIRRCRDRGGDTLTDPEPIAALHRQLSELGNLERHAIDIGDQGREQTLAAVIEALRGGTFRLS